MNKSYGLKNILLILLLCNSFFTCHLFSQDDYERKISISDWIEEMENCTEGEYLLEDTEIYYDNQEDTLYGYWQARTEPSASDKEAMKNIYPIIVINNCKLPDSRTCQVRNIVFHNNISFSSCEGATQLYFFNCNFKQGLDFLYSDLSSILFNYCSIRQRTVVVESQFSILSFANCSFYTDYKLVKSPFKVGYEQENHSFQYLINILQNEARINTFGMSACRILPTDVKPIIAFTGGKYEVIAFQGINFANCIVDFTRCSVKENLTVLDCKFDNPLGMYLFNFPKDNTSFNWSQIDSVGLGLYTSYDQPPYTYETDTLVANVDHFNELNSSYRKFFSMYKTQGDISSANACYTQMKDMETGKYHHLYKQDPGVETWFNWRFNQFLKYFSEYGTNPVQSLIISMWTILIFAAIYFFFYSDWDGINRRSLIRKHRKVMQYFRSEQRLAELYTETYEEDFKTYADYKKEMAEGKIELPLFIVLLGRPLYLFSMLRHKMATFFYQRTEVLHGRWINLKPARRVFVALFMAFSIMIYILGLVLFRALNSTTLSINAFSTLGFGAIPVKGVSRYITIIEGFLGWFLLSIFSVSLISQMLQN